ncbi:acyl-CoA dehydrogenase family protein [Nocardia vaccinii]|uniref:acyl-CoA dehydrogenase family protein n=1 Tax=Nocardia vaccinii TaxID=1822 RepID=UPI00082C3442|nr:acyl-CoA dehydrogenase family protein [Nocardia vaccinii]
MKLAFSSDQEELRQLVRRFLADKAPNTEVRRLMETEAGYEPAVWSQMASQLGLQGLVIPEEYGGAGYSWRELVVVLEEMGRSLLCAPFFATVVLASTALLAAGDEAANDDLLPGIASGQTIATLAFTEDCGRWGHEGIQLTATPAAGGGWALSGHKNYVVDGSTATLLLVVGRSPDGLSLFAVDGAAAGLSRTSLSTLDQTRKLARLEFHNTPARMIGAAGRAAGVLSRTSHLAAIALAAEQIGGAQYCLEMSVDYSKARFQFGRPIGSFQAIKHMCANMLIEIESARSAAYYAGWVAAEDEAELPLAASLAKVSCSDAFLHSAANTIQIHGGIGVTWEHDAHLYLKRAKASQLFLGDSRYHRALLAERIGV